jgi:hypothetical protein
VQDPPISHKNKQQNDVTANQKRSVDLYYGLGHKKRLTHNHQVRVMFLPTTPALITVIFLKQISLNPTPHLKTQREASAFAGSQIYLNQARTPYPSK